MDGLTNEIPPVFYRTLSPPEPLHRYMLPLGNWFYNYTKQSIQYRFTLKHRLVLSFGMGSWGAYLYTLACRPSNYEEAGSAASWKARNLLENFKKREVELLEMLYISLCRIAL